MEFWVTVIVSTALTLFCNVLCFALSKRRMKVLRSVPLVVSFSAAAGYYVRVFLGEEEKVPADVFGFLAFFTAFVISAAFLLWFCIEMSRARKARTSRKRSRLEATQRANYRR
jgi:threonine/homoserine/homoserine lactone efflux protein